MKMNITILLFCSLFYYSSLYSKNILIIIHGTFAKDALWYQPGGDFYTALRTSFKEHALLPFMWSGGLGEAARMQGAKELANFIITYYHPHDRFSLIGHSHGVDVALDTAEILSSTSYKMYRLYTLGGPIRLQNGRPNMNVIEKVHNFFSYGDRVQPIIQLFSRIFPSHPRITNTQLRIHSRCPDHTNMHHPLLAYTLPLLDTILLEKKNCVLNLYKDAPPSVEEDINRTWDLYIDRKFTFSIIADIARKKGTALTS